MARKRRAPKGTKTGRGVPAVENCQRNVRLQLATFESFLARARRDIGLGREAAFVRFVTDREMKRLNRTFRKKAKTTDVLSFPSEERSGPPELRKRARALRGKFLGDIAISPAVAKRNAKLYGRSLAEEICILMLHGVLHLLGYDHESDRGEMERVEGKLRRRLRLAR
jgi:probable rRNA maturation factor